jgi:radical SAM protein with 4Fe4S-binding SPASM domain
MAEIKSKQDENRVKLEEVVPLETPFVLQLAVASACNYGCKYCPASATDLLKAHNVKGGVMKYDLFCKIIDDLEMFPEKIKVLRLVKEGEPLLNKRLPDMIRYAKSRQPDVMVDTTTNAHLLSKDVSDQLIDAGLDKIHISLQGITNESYKRVAGVDLEFSDVIERVKYFFENRRECKVYVKVPDVGISEAEQPVFYDLFDKIADEVFVERMVPTWPDFDFTDFKSDDGLGYYGQPVLEHDVNVCSPIFYWMVLNHDGTASPCVVDWKHISDFDDVRKTSVYDIWNGKNMNDLRRQHLRGERRQNALCGKCETLQYCNVDLIDDHANNILTKFEALP